MIKKIILVFITIHMLSACTPTMRSHYHNIRLAMTSDSDGRMERRLVEDSDVQVAFVKSGDRGWATVALAFNENGQEKWISGDRAMLVTKNGYVIKTIGFTNDLMFTSDLDSLPLPDYQQSSTWTRYQDWFKGEYGYEVHSKFSKVADENIEILGEVFNTVKVRESAEYLGKANSIRFDDQWNNYFWYDKKSGALLQSQQKVSPFADEFTITYASLALSLGGAK